MRPALSILVGVFVGLESGGCSGGGASTYATDASVDVRTTSETTTSDSNMASASDATGRMCVSTSYGCTCSTGASGTPSECSAASISNDAGVAGYCCGTDPCDCQKLECATSSTAADYCYCGAPDPVIQGPRSKDCSAVQASNPSVNCCFGPSDCTCSTLPCSFISQPVANCSTAMIAALLCAGEPQVDICH